MCEGIKGGERDRRKWFVFTVVPSLIFGSDFSRKLLLGFSGVHLTPCFPLLTTSPFAFGPIYRIGIQCLKSGRSHSQSLFITCIHNRIETLLQTEHPLFSSRFIHPLILHYEEIPFRLSTICATELNTKFDNPLCIKDVAVSLHSINKSARHDIDFIL